MSAIDTAARAMFTAVGVDWVGDGEITVTAHEAGVLFAIDQTHAMDSYNHDITCSAFVSWDMWDEMVQAISEVRS